jgi:hypothetical protein
LLIGSLDKEKTLEALTAGGVRYDVILGRNWLIGSERKKERTALLQAARNTAAPGGKLYLAEPQPGKSTTLRELLPPGVLGKEEERRFRDCEKEFLENLTADLAPESLKQIAGEAGWEKVHTESRSAGESRQLAESLLNTWLSPGRRGSYGTEMAALMGEENWEETSARIKAILTGRTVHWETAMIIISASV